MKALYKDILNLTKKKPVWYDSNGVPRYAAFHPEDVPSIYAKIAVLLEVECQECGEKFMVGVYNDGMNPWDLEYQKRFQESLTKWKKAPRKEPCPFGYGDPPRHGGKYCAAGDTMGSITLRVVAYFEKDKHFHWKRVKRLEGEINDC